jgi:hypothetical protein
MNVRRSRYWNLSILPMLAFVWACGPLDAEEGEFAGVPSGTSLEIQLDETLSTRTTRVGSPISGSVLQPVVFDGVVVIPEGARVGGVVTSISREPPVVSAELNVLRVDGTVYSIRGVVTEATMVRRSEMKDEAARPLVRRLARPRAPESRWPPRRDGRSCRQAHASPSASRNPFVWLSPRRRMRRRTSISRKATMARMMTTTMTTSG